MNRYPCGKGMASLSSYDFRNHVKNTSRQCYARHIPQIRLDRKDTVPVQKSPIIRSTAKPRPIRCTNVSCIGI